MSLSIRVALFASLLAVVSIGVVASLEYRYDTEALLHVLGDSLTDVASLSANLISGDIVAEIPLTPDVTNPAYVAVERQLAYLGDCLTFEDRRFCVLVRDGDQLVVVVSAAPRIAAGTRLPLMPEQGPVLAGLTAGHLHRDDPEFGHLVTAYAPIRRSDGAVVGLLAVETTPKEVRQHRQETLRRTAYFALVGVAFATALSLLFVRSLLGPVRMLVQVARRLGEGDYETPVEGRGAGEIGVLAGTMEEMRQALRQRISELDNLNLDLARRVQASIIPKPQRSEWMEVAVAYRPLVGVGGDYAHIYFAAPDVLYVCIGDVTGHGVPAALLVNRAHSLIDQLVHLQLSPDEMLRRINTAVLSSFQQEATFMTFLCANINLQYGQVLFANAAHPPALLFRRGDGEVTAERFESQCTFLGIQEELVCDIDALGATDLVAGDRLVLYTDGLTEASRGPRQFFGEEGLVRVVRENFHLLPQELAERLLAEAEAFAGGELQDDVLVLVIHIHKAGEDRPQKARAVRQATTPSPSAD